MIFDKVLNTPLLTTKFRKLKSRLLLFFDGGIAGDDDNDTDYHQLQKNVYCEKEMWMVLQELEEIPGKIPSSTKNEMMEMFDTTWYEA